MIRLMRLRATLRTSSARVHRAVRSVIGVDEALLLTGVGLIVVALWPVLGRLTLVIPGAVIVWLALPPRLPFLHRPSREESTRRTP